MTANIKSTVIVAEKLNRNTDQLFNIQCIKLIWLFYLVLHISNSETLMNHV